MRVDKALPRMNYYVDVFGYCNLRCPSCPVGNWPKDEASYTKGMISEDLFRRILEKAKSESTVASIGLFNWTEPLLNPNLPALIRMVKSYGLWSAVSSNLNLLKNEDALMAADPDWFRVSVSGFRQEIYERNHREGDIEQVKRNMRLLADAKKRTGARTDCEVFFHRYVDNAADEEPMRAYAESLGYRFQSAWAYMMPVEKIISYVDPSSPEVVLTSEDYALMDRLALPTDEAVALTASHHVTRCDLQDEFMAIDVKGDVYLCCATSGRPTNRIGGFLELTLEEIQARKREHRLCGSCMKMGLPDYLSHREPKFEELGQRQRRLWQERQESFACTPITS